MKLKPKERRFRRLRRFLLWLALGSREFDYMATTLRQDPRLRRCKTADIVVRQDGHERRIEADWLKRLAIIVYGDAPLAAPPLPQDMGERWATPVFCARCKRGSFTELEHLTHECQLPGAANG